jgi:hypothetical protein
MSYNNCINLFKERVGADEFKTFSDLRKDIAGASLTDRTIEAAENRIAQLEADRAEFQDALDTSIKSAIGEIKADELTPEETEKQQNLKLALPTFGEEQQAAKARIKERIAKRKEKAVKQPKFSKGEGTGTTIAAATEALESQFNKKTIDKLIDGKAFKIVQSITDLPAHLQDAGTRGVYDPNTNTSYIVADMVSPETITGVMLHELGVHHGLEGMLGKDTYTQVKKQVENMLKLGNKAATEARAKVPNDTPAQYVTEETIAYMVENKANQGISVVKKIIAAIRKFLRSLGLVKGITDNDLVMMARAAVNSLARGQNTNYAPAPAFAKVSTNTKAFKNWFGNSKVVDENGKPLVVYHGGLGAEDIEIFESIYGGQTTGNNEHGAFHFTDNIDVAEDYGRQSFIRRYQDYPEGLIADGKIPEDTDINEIGDVYGYVDELAENNIETQSVYLKIENPYVIDMEGQVVDVQHIENLSTAFKAMQDGDFSKIPDDAIDDVLDMGFYEPSDIADYQNEINEKVIEDYSLESIEDAEEWQIASAIDEVLSENSIERTYPAFDGIIIKNMVDNIGDASNRIADQFIVFDSRNIKSAFNNTGSFSPYDPRINYAKQADTFYSQMQKVLTDKLPNKGTPEQFKQAIQAYAKKGDFKAEELEWSGVEDWLDQQTGKVSKQDVIDFMAANQIEVKEVEKGGVDESEIEAFMADEAGEGFTREEAIDYLKGNQENKSLTEFEDYQLPGGENYRELLLTLPTQQKDFEQWQVLRADGVSDGMWATKEQAEARAEKIGGTLGKFTSKEIDTGYRSPHYDELNILAHIRFNERADVDGKRVLFIEEVQSDWHQQGKREGYKGKTTQLKLEQRNDGWYVVNPIEGGGLIGPHTESTARILYEQDNKIRGGAPDAPFKTTWPLLAMKRMIRYAAEKGFDQIAWTTGEQQATRYDLSRQIDTIIIARMGENKYDLVATKWDRPGIGSNLINEEGITLERIESLVGKEFAEKAKSQENNYMEYSGGDLTIGGEGMKGFYDKILPATLNKYVKKWGVKVGTTGIPKIGPYETGGNLQPQREAASDFYDNNVSLEDAKQGMYSAYPNTPRKIINKILAGVYPFPVQSLEITPEMKASVMAGQPLFSKAAHDTKAIGDSLGEQATWLKDNFFKKLKTMAKDKRQVLLKWMTGRQIIESYGGMFGGEQNPLEQHGKELQEMESMRENAMHKAEREVIDQWEKLDKQSNKAVADVMADATYYEIHPEQALEHHVNFNFEEARIRELQAREAKLVRMLRARPGEALIKETNELNDIREELQTRMNAVKFEKKRRNAYDDLVARYKALSPKAKQVYHAVKKAYIDQWNSMELELVSRIGRAINNERVYREQKGRIDAMFKRAKQRGPYFPMARFGDYVVTAKDTDGDYVREHAETEFEQAKIMEMMEAEGYEEITPSKVFKGKLNSFTDAPKFALEVFKLMDENHIQNEQLQDDIYQLTLKMMPELSFAKHSIHRRRIAGYSKDMMRAFSSSMMHGSHHISRIAYSDKLIDSLDAMDKLIGQHRAGEQSPINKQTVNAATDVAKVMRDRLERIMNPIGSPWTAKAGNLGFTFFLGASPAAGLVNLSQTALVAYPKLAARFGWKKSGSYLMQAMRDYMKSATKMGVTDSWKSLVRNENISVEERAFIQEMINNGTIDVTQSHWISSLADMDTRYRKELTQKQKKSMQYITSMFHNAEVLNREVTLLAAYRLAKDSGQVENPTAFAQKMTFDTHFDYASMNRAQYMKGDVVKVMTMFKNYSQHMIYLLAHNAYQTYKVGKQAGFSAAWQSEYRKSLTGVLGMHALFAGALGMPMASAVFETLDMAFGDEDDPYDSKAEFQTWAHENFGPILGEAVTKGVFNAVGIDVHARVSLNDLIIRSDDRDKEGRDKATFYLEQAAGPMFGIMASAFQGMKDWGQGEEWRGLERMVPKFMRDVSKATRYMAEEGVLTYSDEAIVDDLNMLELGTQLLGFTPARVSAKYDLRNAVKGMETKYKNRRKELMNQYYLAIKNRDFKARRDALDAIAQFNEANSDKRYVRITSAQLRQSVKSRKQSAKQTDDGIYLDKKYQPIREMFDY